jgi:hypothetical protein
MWLSKSRAFTIKKHNYAEGKQKSFKIMIIKIFAISDKAKPYTENVRGFNLAAVTCTAVQVSIQPWQRELLLAGHNLLY